MANIPVSAQLKLRRAQEHRSALESEIVTWAASKPYEYFTREVEDSDPDFQRIQYVVKVNNPLPGDRLGQILGDCLNNYRGVLDHIIWELSNIHTGGMPKNPTRIGFPAPSTDATLSGLHSVSAAVMSDVSQLHSSCAPAEPGDPSPFALLIGLSNADKHRTIPFGFHVAKSSEIALSLPVIGTRFDVHQVDVLMDGTVLADILIPRPLFISETVEIRTKQESGVVISKTEKTPQVHLGMSIEAIDAAVEASAALLSRHFL
jgi:hypothetical protein